VSLIPTRGKVARKILRRYAEGDEQRGLATKEDLKSLKKDIEHSVDNTVRKRTQPTREQPVLKAVKMFAHGFANINKSMNTPQSPNRPRISQLPGRRTDMGIVSNVNEALEKLVDPRLRGRDLRGRKTK
jgi:hypothetical protein